MTAGNGPFLITAGLEQDVAQSRPISANRRLCVGLVHAFCINYLTRVIVVRTSSGWAICASEIDAVPPCE